MTAFEEIWSGSVAAQVEALPADIRDQVASLVRQVCGDPLGPDTAEAVGRPRTRVARAGRLTVQYQVDEIGEMVYVVGVDVGG